MSNRRIASLVRETDPATRLAREMAAPLTAPPEPEVLAEAARALQMIEQAQRMPGVMSTVQDPFASLLQTHLAKFGPASPTASAQALEVKYDERDVIGWAASVVFDWWKRITKFKWVEPGTLAEPFPNTARVAVFGDWATGLYGAPIVSQSIVDDSAGHQLVLHLGDTYYSGDDDEVADGLIAFWPRVTGATHRALNGNHEMYTGGKAYFNAIGSEFGQRSSYFALQNDHWILAGLDSAYSDHDLHGNQAAWITSLLAQAGGRRLILFSHHQPYSLLDTQGPKLVAKLSNQLKNRQIFAWYWGHEHRCVLYDAHPSWGLLGRCIGHGGFPYFRDNLPGAGGSGTGFLHVDGRNGVPGADVLDGPNQFVKDHENQYGPHGFVSLEFDGPHVNEVVRDATGTVLRSTQLA
ncbi:MAG: hypothetical protein ABI972_15740 [Acidobacteriota bacterium]